MIDGLKRKTSKKSELRRGVLILTVALVSLLALELYGCHSDVEALKGADQERNFDKKEKSNPDD